MDIEAIKTELNTKMESAIVRLHKMNHSRNEAGSVLNANTGESYREFKRELKETIIYIIDKHEIAFHNVEESNNFLYKLKPTIDELLNRYFIG